MALGFTVFLGFSGAANSCTDDWNSMQKLVIAAAVHGVPKPHVWLDALRLEYRTLLNKMMYALIAECEGIRPDYP